MMPAPVITEVNILYPAGRNYLLPGESAQVEIDVYDPTGSIAEITFQVTDMEGHTSSGAATIPMNDEVTTAANLRQMDYDAGWRLDRLTELKWAVTAPEDFP
jgi:hypothetical protein